MIPTFDPERVAANPNQSNQMPCKYVLRVDKSKSINHIACTAQYSDVQIFFLAVPLDVNLNNWNRTTGIHPGPRTPRLKRSTTAVSSNRSFRVFLSLLDADDWCSKTPPSSKKTPPVRPQLPGFDKLTLLGVICISVPCSPCGGLTASTTKCGQTIRRIISQARHVSFRNRHVSFPNTKACFRGQSLCIEFKRSLLEI